MTDPTGLYWITPLITSLAFAVVGLGVATLATAVLLSRCNGWTLTETFRRIFDAFTR